jgi:all-trans-8'-apo-beta-carotenal 15,15'-oxygenase
MFATHTARTLEAPEIAGNVVQSYRQGLRNLEQEHGFAPLTTDGQVPQDLRGTFYLNGPGLFSLFGQTYKHWFDGDGAMTAVNFGETVTGAVRLVESRQLKEECDAGRPLYTSGSTLAPQWWRRLGLRFKNVANTKPLWWNQRLFALYEAGLPTELQPKTLDTLGETALGGTIKGYFSAHFHEVPARKAFYNFSIQRGRKPRLHVYELPQGGQIRRLASLPIPKSSAMLHDFIATEKHLVFFIPPVRISALPVILGLKAPSATMRWRPEEGTTVLIVPIDAPHRYTSFKVDAFFQYHFMNAYEQGDDIIVDFVRVMDFESAFKKHAAQERTESFPTEGRLYRAYVQPKKKTVRLEQRWSQPCEFPQVAPAVQGCRHRYGYVLASRDGEPQTKIAKIDYETGGTISFVFAPNQFPSEAVFVPRQSTAEEDDGYLISLVYDANTDRCYVAVFDAQRLGHGPLAQLWFAHHIPRPIHGTWASE